ncbi:YlbF family regulator [Paenibacillus sp. J5C_2022]|uniref:RicAFT regulatory complex protein RicA family protein n=1 Tax=Paenibacillus sp. J5C2022 TaxID=2977129 RepID=UPI0021D0E618|nr:YlbF family regulator [Paenibacillus sp. J5C2022]MCU6707185.1 YlbF family regulator [Paenibacillus sp. J5C2022]
MAEQQLKAGHEDGAVCSHGGGKSDMPSIHSRDVIVKEDIMAKAKELSEAIFRSEEVQQYRLAEAQINGNTRIQGLIAQIKKKQKEAVAFEKTFKNPDMVKKIEGEMEALQDELDGIPIVTQFQQSQADINYLLQLVVSIIRDTVSEKINVENAVAPDPETCSD